MSLPSEKRTPHGVSVSLISSTVTSHTAIVTEIDRIFEVRPTPTDDVRPVLNPFQVLRAMTGERHRATRPEFADSQRVGIGGRFGGWLAVARRRHGAQTVRTAG